MKIGIISDIHGDSEALLQALARLEQVHGVDRVLCAGDLVGRGPDPARVVAIVRERGIPVVQGNHDGWAYGMGEEELAYLKTLPLDWRDRLAGVSVFMTHGKPGNNMWGLYAEHISADVVDLMLEALGTEVLITGHTHKPLFMRGQRTALINPGSLYLFASRRPSSHTYGVLSLPQIQFELFDLTGSPDRPLIIP